MVPSWLAACRYSASSAAWSNSSITRDVTAPLRRRLPVLGAQRYRPFPQLGWRRIHPIRRIGVREG